MARASPFSLQDKEAYRRWREQKLQAYPETAESLVVEIGDPRALTEAEAGDILRVCRKTNMAIYASHMGGLEDKTIPRALGERFGLQRLDNNMLADDDGITSLQVVPGKSRRGYIPYSNRRLLWHTDGYYNSPESFIRAFVLHCVSPAADGGENSLLDHEIVYLLMRDANPEYIRALMAPDAMTIPANTESGEETRAASIGPVFSGKSAPALYRAHALHRVEAGRHDAGGRALSGESAQRRLPLRISSSSGARAGSDMQQCAA
jgi:hypothetical protein